MRSGRKSFVSLLFVLLIFSSILSFAQQTWQQVPIPALPKFTPQEPARFVLPNGMVIFLQEDHELPLISGTALIKGGSSSEPASKIGLVSIYAATWRTSGTRKNPGDQLDDQLEAIGAKVARPGSFSTGAEATSTGVAPFSAG